MPVTPRQEFGPLLRKSVCVQGISNYCGWHPHLRSDLVIGSVASIPAMQNLFTWSWRVSHYLLNRNAHVQRVRATSPAGAAEIK